MKAKFLVMSRELPHVMSHNDGMESGGRPERGKPRGKRY